MDYHTRMTWVAFLKDKIEAFMKFKSSKALVENQTNHQIKCLSLENGGEFISNELN